MTGDTPERIRDGYRRRGIAEDGGAHPYVRENPHIVRPEIAAGRIPNLRFILPARFRSRELVLDARFPPASSVEEHVGESKAAGQRTAPFRLVIRYGAGEQALCIRRMTVLAQLQQESSELKDCGTVRG